MRPINLLPPEVAEERAKRRRAGLLIVVGVVYLAALAGGVFYWNSRVSAAKADVEAQQEANRTLEREVAALADAGALQEEFETKAALVRTALAADVDWGVFLNDLSRLVPPRVWIQSFAGAIEPGASAELVGAVFFNGVGFDFPDVSEWLRSLGSEGFSGVTGPWVSTATEGVIGEEPVVNFSSTAALTAGALTDRAEDLIPEVP
ncbi:MAG TPA: PilN domain-containing protein [Acidimicrobiia bacterium]|nr:PilN domain-containing protein [Acidimicrobiia bacterium]